MNWITPASAATPRSPRPSGLYSCGCSAPVSPSVCVKRPLLPAYVLAAVVGYSRLVIHAHSVSEVIAGLLLGAAGSALFLVLQKRTPDPESVNISWGGVACLVMVPLILLHSGSKAPTQSLLGQIATAVGPLDKPFTRTDLHKQASVIAICFTEEIKFSPVN
ncbi:phosphatase PAP2 family protein [Klebsiella pneumoniae]|nr:phosphatase PAP2 family protein [Klebsiella pneumoniae]